MESKSDSREGGLIKWHQRQEQSQEPSSDKKNLLLQAPLHVLPEPKMFASGNYNQLVDLSTIVGYAFFWFVFYKGELQQVGLPECFYTSEELKVKSDFLPSTVWNADTIQVLRIQIYIEHSPCLLSVHWKGLVGRCINKKVQQS